MFLESRKAFRRHVVRDALQKPAACPGRTLDTITVGREARNTQQWDLEPGEKRAAVQVVLEKLIGDDHVSHTQPSVDTASHSGENEF